jgi:N-methylhydantoinase A
MQEGDDARSQGPTRLGVDVGGTFTDLIFYDPVSGEIGVAKALTTPASPEEGILDAVAAGVPDGGLERTAFFLHGTTVGLNALLERRGAIVGLLTTEGFRDTLELRRGDRAAMYDLFWHPGPPLVPRRLRIPITERLRASGEVQQPIDLDQVRRAVSVFRDEGVTAVAVVFLHAYANGAHELAAAQALREAGYEGAISLSHQVSGEYREYERTTTTVVDAFVRARMADYLQRLELRLVERGFSGSSLVTRSGGGAMTFAEAAERPFETIMSGPVAGAEGASELARTLDCDQVITADVGGTSFDTCLISQGQPSTRYEGEVVGLPLQTPWVDVRSIGAGGGSVAYVDEGGLLRVGPRSAGADPGPACYGRGGTEPTVTDAAFLLGMLGHGELAGGVALDPDAALAAVEPLGAALGFSWEQVARGILTIAGASMAGAIREITVEQGLDPRDAALMPFGGAGPLFLSLLARELEMRRVILPPHAGNFSAWGLLGADLVQTAARTRVTALTDAELEGAEEALAELFSGLERRATLPAGTTPMREVRLDMRYVGQEHTLTVAVDAEGGVVSTRADALREQFHQEYRQTFGLEMDESVEIVSLRATQRTALPRGSHDMSFAAVGGDGSRTVRAFSFADAAWTDFALVQRADLASGASIAGPAIVLEPTATAYIDRGLRGRVHESGCIVLDVGDS